MRAEPIPTALPKRSYTPSRMVTPTPEPLVFEMHESTAPLPSVAPATKTAAQITITEQKQPAAVLDLLRSASSVRNAVILREILGPPRGVEPFELSGAVWASESPQ